jgi:hypothetical protein
MTQVLHAALLRRRVLEVVARQVAQESERLHQVRLARRIRPQHDIQRPERDRRVPKTAEVAQA